MGVSEQQKRKRGHDEPEPQDENNVPPPPLKAGKPPSSRKDIIKNVAPQRIVKFGHMMNIIPVEYGFTNNSVAPFAPMKPPHPGKIPREDRATGMSFIQLVTPDGEVLCTLGVINGRITHYMDESGNIRVMPGDGVMPIPQPDRPL